MPLQHIEGDLINLNEDKSSEELKAVKRELVGECPSSYRITA